jgi:hypothetical protein
VHHRLGSGTRLTPDASENAYSFPPTRRRGHVALVAGCANATGCGFGRGLTRGSGEHGAAYHSRGSWTSSITMSPAALIVNRIVEPGVGASGVPSCQIPGGNSAK